MSRWLMYPLRRSGLVIVLVGLGGCGGTRATPADADQARAAVRTALEAWKADSLDKLAKVEGIVFNDHDCRAGRRLVEYKIEADDRFGNSVRCRAVLSLRDRDGKTLEKRIAYLVDTSPTIVIVREDLGA